MKKYIADHNSWFLLFFLFPTVFIPFVEVSLSKQISALFLIIIGATSFFIIRKVPNNMIVYCLLLLFLIGLLTTLNTSLDGTFSFQFRLFAEPLRIIGLCFFFSIGYYISHQYTDLDFFKLKNKNYIFIIIFSILLLLSYFYRESSFGILSNFYSSEEHRFSFVMPGINYVWFPLLIFIFISLRSGSKIFFFVVLIIASLVLLKAKSFTSFAAVLLSLLIYFCINNFTGVSITKKIYSIVLLFLFTSILMYFVFDILSLMSNISSKYLQILIFFEDFDIAAFSSMSKRIVYWDSVISLINQRPFFGYGFSKSILEYTDNTYLMTLVRYGYFGLFLELSIYIYLFKSISSLSGFYKSALYAIFSGYILSGFTVNVFYELKLPYFFFLLFGIVVGLRTK